MIDPDQETATATNHSANRTSPFALFLDPVWCIALLAVVALAFFVRGSMLFRGAVPAGMDAGYYAVQARELLEHGTLRWADVPLTFLSDALLAKCTMWLLGWDIDTATLWASRAVDTLAEPLAAIPLFMAAWIFGRGTRNTIPSAVAVGLALTVSPPLLRMVGDFEKQSMAYGFMASTWIGTWTAMRSSDRRGSQRWWLATVMGLALTALTHVGTCAATALGCVLMLAVWTVRVGISPKNALRGLLRLTVVGAVLFAAVWCLAPGKAEAIINLPAKLISVKSESPDGIGGPPGPPISGAWMGAAWFTALVAGTAVLAWASSSLQLADAENRAHKRADEAFLFGMLMTAACLACPLLSGDRMMRLALMEPVPLAFIGVFLLCTPRQRAGRTLQPSMAVIAATALILTANASKNGPLMHTVDDEGFAELRSWRAEIAPGNQAVVAARHGLEFWAAFAMDTHARLGTLKDADFDRYERIYILEARRGSGEPPCGRGQRPMSVTAVPHESRIVKQSERFTLWQVLKSARHSFGNNAERTGRPHPLPAPGPF